MFRIPKWLQNNLPSFEYFRKIALTTFIRKARRGRDSSSSSFFNTIQYPSTLKNNVYHSYKRKPPTFFHSDTNTWPRSGPFCRQNPCSPWTVELIWLLFLNIFSFKFVLTTNKSLRFTRFTRSYVNRPAVGLPNHFHRYFCLMCAVLSPMKKLQEG